MATRAEVIAKAVARLVGAGVPQSERDARLLYRWAANMDGAALSAALSDHARPAEIVRFDRAIDLRVSRVPVSQIIGEREFWGRRFRVTADTLDPRPETETMVAEALAGGPGRRVLDLGTGTGCLILTLLAEWPEAIGTGTDASPAALAVAAENAERLGMSGRCGFVCADWWHGVGAERYDVILSNPPYIPEQEIAGLAPEVRLHEPRMALTPGGDGLAPYRTIAAGACDHLDPGGRLYLEIGPTQGRAVAEILAAHGLGDIRIVRDLDGRERVVAATCRTNFAASEK